MLRQKKESTKYKARHGTHENKKSTKAKAKQTPNQNQTKRETQYNTSTADTRSFNTRFSSLLCPWLILLLYYY